VEDRSSFTLRPFSATDSGAESLMGTVPGESLRYPSLNPRLLSLTPLASRMWAMKVGGWQEEVPKDGLWFAKN